MFRTCLLNLFAVPLAFAGLSMSNAVLTGSATLNGTNVADQAFVSNVVAMSAADKATTSYVDSAVATGILGVAYSSDVQTNLLAVSNSIRVAVTAEISGFNDTRYLYITGSLIPSVTYDTTNFLASLTQTYWNNMSNYVDGAFNSNQVALAAGLQSASNYTFNASNNLAVSLNVVSNQAQAIGSAFPVADALWYAMSSNYTWNVSNNLRTVMLNLLITATDDRFTYVTNAVVTGDANTLQSALTAVAGATNAQLSTVWQRMAATSNRAEAVAVGAYNYTYSVSNWLQNVIDTSVAELSVTDTTNRTYLAGLLEGTNRTAVTRLVVLPSGPTNTWSFDVAAASVPSSRVWAASFATSGVYRVVTTDFTNTVNAASLGNIVTNMSTSWWGAVVPFPARILDGNYYDTSPLTSFLIITVPNIGQTEMVVKLFDTTFWDTSWDFYGDAPLATGLVTQAMLTNGTITLYSSTNGYWGTVTLEAEVGASSTNLFASCPIKDPFPSIALASNRANAIVTGAAVVSNTVTGLSLGLPVISNRVNSAIAGAAVVSNTVTGLSAGLPAVSNTVNSAIAGAAVTSNKVSFSLFTNCVRLVTFDDPPVVAYIAVSNGALVVLPAPPTAP